MDTLKFNTFANSPKSLSALPSKLLTQQSFSPNQNPFTSSIPDLKRQMQQAINSKRASRKSKKMHNKYPSQISLMKSDISLLSVPGIQMDLPLTMLQLEVGVTEEILALREDKLTLMEQYNRIVGDRYKVERDLTRLKKVGERQSSDVNDLSIFENQNSSSKKKVEANNETILKNQALKNEFMYLEKQNESSSGDFPKEYEEQLLMEIENFQQNSRIMEQKLSKIEGNIRPDQDQRFETFFPGKPGSRNENQSEQAYYQLSERKSYLLRQLARQAPPNEQQKYFMELIEENEELLEKVDRMKRARKGVTSLGLQYLREKVQEEEEAKALFFQDLKKFKEEAKRYREMNEQMRNRLGL